MAVKLIKQALTALEENSVVNYLGLDLFLVEVIWLLAHL